jgi:hypothetical protein
MVDPVETLNETNSRFAHCFREGLARVATVIDINPDYHAIIGHKIKDDFRQRLQAAPEQQAVRELESSVSSMKLSTYRLPDVDFLFFGRTANNRREFAFLLETLAPIKKHVVHANTADLKYAGRVHDRDDIKGLYRQLEPTISEYFSEKSTVSPELVYQLAQYAVHFLRYWLSAGRQDSVLPSLAVVANDHSPNAVAYAQAMTALGVPTLYLQHAEVSTGFPGLNFDFSVLRNPASERIYESISRPSGRVYVVSRYAQASRLPLVSAVEAVSVVIYTTGRVDAEGLGRVVTELRRNALVSSIHLKLHPNQGAFHRPADIPVLEDIPAFPHVALAANSSVVIDLLHQGIPTYQNFDFDPVDADYYKFVERKIVGLAPTDQLRTPFWTQFDYGRDWQTRFADLFTGEPGRSEQDKHRLITDIEALLDQRTKPRIQVITPPVVVRTTSKSKLKPVTRQALDLVAKIAPGFVLEAVKHYAYSSSLQGKKAIQELRAKDVKVDPGLKSLWLQKSIAASRDPIDWLRSSLMAEIVSEDDAVKALTQLYADRNPVIFEMFDAIEHQEDLGVIYLWLSFKRAEVSGVAHHYPLRGMIESVLEVPAVLWSRSELEGLAFGAILRAEQHDLLELFFERSSKVRKDRLSTSRKVALLRHLWRTGRSGEFDVLREEFWRAESPFNRLKIVDLDGTLGTRHGCQTHSEMEFAFRTSAPAAIAGEYDHHVRPVYEVARSKMQFMDVRSSSSERENFDNLVLAALRSLRPFSMIRLSDGEGHAFADKGEFFTAEDRRNRERHWWGVELDDAVRVDISARVRKAADNADVLGIPSIHRFVRDLNDKSLSMKASVQGRGLLQVLHYIKSTAIDALIGDEKMNLPIFRRTQVIREYMAASTGCVVVSSSSPDALPSWLSKDPKTAHIQIPTHLRTSRNGKYLNADRPLPFVYEAVDRQVAEMSRPGMLVLVAGGIIGKIFIDTARSRGAVALDLGSVMDEWSDAGIHSLH